MSNLSDLTDVLNSHFFVTGSYLEEIGDEVKMIVELDRNGCQAVVFELDKKLNKDYKGGLFPFFNNSMKKVGKKCDYIIFSKRNQKLFALIVEMKSSAQSTMPQLNAGECFVDYVIETATRVHGIDFNVVKRKISIRECDRKKKKKTKMSDVTYDTSGHLFFEGSKFRIAVHSI